MRTYEIHEEIVAAQSTAAMHATLEVGTMAAWFTTTYAAVARTLAVQGVAMAGPPYARYHVVGPGRFSVEAGFPVAAPVTASDGVRPSVLPGGPVATTVHVGPYDQMAPAYEAINTWIRDHGGEPMGDAWEVYLSEPSGDPTTWRTKIVQPYLVTR